MPRSRRSIPAAPCSWRIHAVLTARDIPGLNGYGIAVPDQPVLCDRKVRYLGDPVALVVGVAVGVRTFDLPATPEKVYRLLQAKSRTTQWERAKGQEASL